MIIGESDKAYRYQVIQNPNHDRPAGWIDVDSIVLQGPSPLSASLNRVIIVPPATNYVKHLLGAIQSSPRMSSIDFTEGLTQKKQVQTDFEYESSANAHGFADD